MSSRYAVAPTPPTGPGEEPEDRAVEHYLSELARWRMRREHELSALDELTRTHLDRDALNEDVTASMTLYHAIAQRHDLLLATWEDARDGDGEREWVSTLLWGVLEMPDGDPHALALALPDALRMSDALAASLRARTGADGEELPVRQRVASLRADLDRLEGVVARDDSAEPGVGAGSDGGADMDPELTGRLAAARRRLDGLGRRADPEALVEIGELESELAGLERALLVAAAEEAHGTADAGQARAERDQLVAKGEAVRALAARVLESVTPAPSLGIPDVTALGEVPTEESELIAYMGNLERVGRALDQAHATYAAALAEYADLADRAQRLASTLAGCGAPTSVDLSGMLTAAKESLHNKPADVRRAAALVAAQEAYLAQLRPES
ncbi:hypothetical protein ACQE98_08490 [Ornithinimicrobium sp. W1679]|uniref:hypothetical protein n=1 Tax=Ornithinimicrobium sp. W1679 TaxID=3418770 RepID=UPI003CE98798